MISSPTNRSMHDTRCLKSGVVLNNRYKIEEVIGAGGFGITYKAWDPILQTYVAIKEYYPSGVATRDSDSTVVCVPVQSEKKEFRRGLIRFLKEAQDVARFQTDPNIVRIYDYLEANDTAYIIMEYLHGCTWKQYINTHADKVDYDLLLHICLSVTDALETIHGAGMIHRDISPENIFICDDYTIKLIDFGAAKQVYYDSEQTISVVLKPGYAPPEQYTRKDRQGPWTDIYALGATLYFAATGQKAEESIGRVLEDTVVAPDEINRDIPHFMSQIIMKAMAVNTEDRFQSARELKEAVFAGDCSVKQRRHTGLRVPFGLVFCIVIICAAVLYVFVMGRQPEIDDEERQILHLASATSATMVQEASALEQQFKKENDAVDSDDSMVMHVPTDEEQKLQDVLTIVSSQSEGVSLDGFTFEEDVKHGGAGMYQVTEGEPGLMGPIEEYVGDCVRISLEYMDSLKKNPPQVTNSYAYGFTVRKMDESGLYKLISNENGDWGVYDYSTWFSPETHYSSQWFNIYVPLDDYLVDGQYQISFRLGEYETDETIFQTTIEFILNRGHRGN